MNKEKFINMFIEFVKDIKNQDKKDIVENEAKLLKELEELKIKYPRTREWENHNIIKENGEEIIINKKGVDNIDLVTDKVMIDFYEPIIKPWGGGIGYIPEYTNVKKLKITDEIKNVKDLDKAIIESIDDGGFGVEKILGAHNIIISILEREITDEEITTTQGEVDKKRYETENVIISFTIEQYRELE